MVESRCAMTSEVRFSIRRLIPFPQQVFRLRIDAGSGFVEDQNAGIVRQRARERQQLLLPDGERRAALPDGLIKACRQAFNKVLQVHLLRRRAHLRIRNALGPQADVARDGSGKKERVLQHDAKILAQDHASRSSRMSMPSKVMLPSCTS